MRTTRALVFVADLHQHVPARQLRGAAAEVGREELRLHHGDPARGRGHPGRHDHHRHHRRCKTHLHHYVLAHDLKLFSINVR